MITKTQPQRTCAFKKILSRMPPRSHWPNRPDEFHISSSQVVWFIRNETGIKDWSLATKIFHEAKKNKVIVFSHDTRLWRGYLHGDKSAKLPVKWKSKNQSPAGRPDVPGRPLLSNNNNSPRSSAPDK